MRSRFNRTEFEPIHKTPNVTMINLGDDLYIFDEESEKKLITFAKLLFEGEI